MHVGTPCTATSSEDKNTAKEESDVSKITEVNGKPFNYKSKCVRSLSRCVCIHYSTCYYCEQMYADGPPDCKYLYYIITFCWYPSTSPPIIGSWWHCNSDTMLGIPHTFPCSWIRYKIPRTRQKIIVPCWRLTRITNTKTKLTCTKQEVQLRENGVKSFLHRWSTKGTDMTVEFGFASTATVYVEVLTRRLSEASVHGFANTFCCPFARISL